MLEPDGVRATTEGHQFRSQPDDPGLVTGTSTSQLGRVRSLDGLRGVAAAVVVIHHTLLASVAILANTYRGGSAPEGSLGWWLAQTPLHAFWAGPEAVVVFFVLSGFVLALPGCAKGARWFHVSYYPRRLIRLFFPVWGAIALAIGWRALQPRTVVPGATWWLTAHAVPMSAHSAAVQASLRDQGTWAYDPVLWSLHWEVLYSVLLPLALGAALLTRRRPGIAAGSAVAALACTALGRAHNVPQAEYLPMFLVGALLALHAARVRRWVQAWGVVAMSAAVAVTLAGVTAPYWVRPGWVRWSGVQPYVSGAAEAAVVVGSVVLVAVAAWRRSLRRLLERSPVAWLGSRSYSLYLVHEPVVVSLAFALGGRPPFGLLLAVVIPAVLVVTEVFWRVVERPSITLSHRVGREVRSRLTVGPRVRVS